MIGLLVVLIVIGIMTFSSPYFLPPSLAFNPGQSTLLRYLLISAVLVVIYLLVVWWYRRRSPKELDREGMVAPPALLNGNEAPPIVIRDFSPMARLLRGRYGYRWRRKTPWLLVMGEVAEVEQVSPGLTEQGWLLVGHVLLLWGGPLASGGHAHDLQALRRLRRHRPVDALIWVSQAAQYRQPAYADAVCRGYEQVSHLLHWAAPVYLLDLRQLRWPQPERPEQLVGVMHHQRLTLESLASRIEALIPVVRAQGMAQINAKLDHTFLLQLCNDLQPGPVASVEVFSPLLAGVDPLPLYGIAFSPPLSPHNYTPHEQAGSPFWGELARQIVRQAGRPVGITAPVVARWSAAAVMVMFTLGLMVSGASNYRLVTQGAELIQQAESAPSVPLLFALQQPLETLLVQQQQGTPLYRRFGLDVTDRLLPALWPAYTQLAQRFIVQPAQQQLVSGLGSAQPSYDGLKTYLMLALPAHTADHDDQRYFSQQMTALLPTVTPTAVTFFTTQFAQHPEWKITPDSAKVAQARNTLLRNMSGPEAEAQLYQTLLARATRNFGNLALPQLLDGLEADGMFTLDAEVPGSFTRQAYEGAVSPAIATLVASRQEQVGWVLVEPGQTVEASLSPRALGTRLTARYFTDYGVAWQKTLNQLKAQPSDNREKQLTLAADINRSPQMALMKQLAWQGLAGSPNEKQNEVNPALLPVFGGIVAMVSGRGADKGLTLSTWRSQVTSLRDRMRNLSAATGGEAALSQSVFRGTQVDSRIAELPARLRTQLGNGWQPMAQALFLAPLDQTWKGVMAGGIKGMQVQWQQEIAAPWQHAFDQTFPFADSKQEASLALLNEFINPQTGKIARFIHQYLEGVLEYKNDQWQVADKLPPGMKVSPQFLTQLNHLNRLGHTLYGGKWGVNFQLQANAVRDVVKTELNIDGQRVVYFNQMPLWEDIQWPGETYRPGASIIWTSTQAGAQLYFDAPGTWAFFRLLKKAKITRVDDTHYQLTWVTDDGQPLSYQMAFTAGHDPLSLLSLNGFRFPRQIFL